MTESEESKAPTTRLGCGHRVTRLVEVAVKADGTKLYRCPECGELKPKSWTQK